MWRSIYFRPEHAKRFVALNREWLEKYNLMESSEESSLLIPKRTSSIPVTRSMSHCATAMSSVLVRSFRVASTHLSLDFGPPAPAA